MMPRIPHASMAAFLNVFVMTLVFNTVREKRMHNRTQHYLRLSCDYFVWDLSGICW